MSREEGVVSSPTNSRGFRDDTESHTPRKIPMVIKGASLPAPSVSFYPDRLTKHLPTAAWFLYSSALLLLTGVIALCVISFFVDRVHVNMTSIDVAVNAEWQLTDLCENGNGCNMTTLFVSPSMYVSPSPKKFGQFEHMVQSAGPFTVMDCKLLQEETGTYALTLASQQLPLKKVRLSTTIMCNSDADPFTLFSGSFTSSMSSYGLIGAQRFRGQEYFAYALSSVALYVAVAFSFAAFLILAVTMTLLGFSRRQLLVLLLDDEDEDDKDDFDPRCCGPCCPDTCRSLPANVRRLVSAVISCVAIGAVGSIYQLITCAAPLLGVNRMSAIGRDVYQANQLSVPVAHYAVCGLLGAIQLLALIPLCIIHAGEMW